MGPNLHSQWSCKCFPHVDKMPTLTYNRANSIFIMNVIILNIMHNTFNFDIAVLFLQGIETIETIASYDAVDEGTYFVTVIAMNPANDASQAVCSDGVTIVTTKPSVKNVVLNGAKTDPRLVVDYNGTMWIIWTDITRTIVNSSNICKYVTLEYKKVFVFCFFMSPPTLEGDILFLPCSSVCLSITQFVSATPLKLLNRIS